LYPPAERCALACDAGHVSVRQLRLDHVAKLATSAQNFKVAFQRRRANVYHGFKIGTFSALWLIVGVPARAPVRSGLLAAL